MPFAAGSDETPWFSASSTTRPGISRMQMTLSNGWISSSVRRVSGPAGKTRLPRMLPELVIAMSALASARIASATRSPRFVSEARRCRLTPSSGVAVVPAM